VPAAVNSRTSRGQNTDVDGGIEAYRRVMFQTIIAGCDGFDRGREAAAFAARIADAADARLLLVAAYSEPPLPFPEPFREYASQVERAIRGVRDELAPRAETATVEALSPAHALRHTAAREHADLIVVGSRHPGPLDGLARPDHALQVLHSAPESVAVVPEGTKVPPRLARIVAGLDGSPESRAAVDLAAGLARVADARLWLQVVVDDRPTASYIQPPDWWDRLKEGTAAGEALLERTLAELRDVEVDGGVATGGPAEVLAAGAKGSDLLVLGSRRWGPVRRLALGSTAESVVRRGTGPVLVPPRTSHRPQARVDRAPTAAPAR
jgi:nucleotide-binding universal stress UspA family protein